MDLTSINFENVSKITPQISNNGSDFLKRMRSGSIEEEDILIPKLAKTQGSTPLISLSTGPQTRMLSFSNPGSDSYSLSKNGEFGQSLDFPHYAYAVNTGMHAPPLGSGVGSFFTASQWAELQQQTMVYKYIQANATVPSALLLGLKRSASAYLFSGLPPGSYAYTPNSWGWGGSFHLGFSGNNTDPEPGRCRRTDGKKWRCSRDAVPEQKYCERHLNRGRHRSRKLVEGRSGQAVAGAGPTAAATSASKSVVVPPEPAVKGLQPHPADNPSTANLKFNRLTDHQALPVANPATDSKPKDLIFSIPKPSQSDFGLVSSDSLLNPSTKTSYMNNPTTFDPILPFNENNDQYPLRHFMDGEWPKSQSNCATWPEDLKPDWTQLSMSLGFSSTSSSSPQEKMTLLPLSLSHELDPNHKEMNLAPKTWGHSFGGPLGEALLNKTDSGNPKSISNGVWFGSSPTGVLQKADFKSVSNSSNGSSPRGDEVFGTHLATSMFLPSL